MLAKLGDVVFKARDIPINRLRRDTKASWSEHKTLKGRSVVSFCGIPARRIEITGSILCEFHDALSQMEKLHIMTQTGEPLPLSATTKQIGTYLGLWAITSLNEERMVFDSSGHAKKIEFKIELLEVFRDRNQKPTG